ncbi:hypothetical protein [Bacillus wiedmannii]|uniref:Uncharacterized protein n=1 Tax=Bacillus wiedmannii TaxID=1890302 RepID=A0A2B6UB01_9BACI|nr:hypothetical protein [Bacillus wiedmannii]PGD63256.1 hypothetical protein COM41_14865 [Bacillus wiedmannii]PHG63529.1 hypothetical protein COI65_08915 [Bacillus wiedmannii]
MFDTTTNLKEFVYSDLDRFFNYASKDLTDYPKFQKLIKRYKRELWGFGSFYEETLKSYSIKDLILGMGDQCFAKQFFLGESGELGYYHLTWDIVKLKEIIQENEMIPCSFPVNDLINEALDNGVDLRNIDLERENTEPIIIADHPVAQNHYGGIIIDGNHRIAQAYKKGNRQILVYVLPAFVHMKGLLSNLDVFLFKLAYNLKIIGEGVESLNTITNEKAKKELYDTLFKIIYKI